MSKNTHIIKDFGKTLKDIRLKQGLSQGKLAKKLGVHPTYISSFERGIRNPSLKVIERLARALNMPIRNFFK